jgi:hypothetical protein
MAMTKEVWALFAVVAFLGCSKDEAATKTTPSATASASAPAPPLSVAATPSVTASAAPEAPRADCPTGSTGPGTFSSPCVGKGAVRMVELLWNGKSDAKGAPTFRVASKAPKTVIYGRLAIYFYDKAGKQIDVKETAEGPDKSHAFHVCAGNVFAGGGVAPAEKTAYNFSCMGKSNIPEGVASIEAEALMVGFADSTGKKNEFYWRNPDLAPEARPKGGIKK